MTERVTSLARSTPTLGSPLVHMAAIIPQPFAAPARAPKGTRIVSKCAMLALESQDSSRPSPFSRRSPHTSVCVSRGAPSMSRFKNVTLALLIGALFAVPPSASAAQSGYGAPLQPDPPIDVDLVASEVQQIDTQTLIAALRTPPSPTDLPQGYFEGAAFIDPEVVPASGPSPEQLGVIPFDDDSSIPNVEGSVAFTVEAAPEAFGGAASTNSLSYVIVDPIELVDPLSPDETLDEIVSGIEERLEQDTGFVPIDVTVVDDDAAAGGDDTLVEGVGGRLVTYRLATESTSAAAQLYIVPIGNVFIFSLVAVGDDVPIDLSSLSEPAEDLTVAGIEHLAAAVETIGQQ